MNIIVCIASKFFAEMNVREQFTFQKTFPGIDFAKIFLISVCPFFNLVTIIWVCKQLITPCVVAYFVFCVIFPVIGESLGKLLRFHFFLSRRC